MSGCRVCNAAGRILCRSELGRLLIEWSTTLNGRARLESEARNFWLAVAKTGASPARPIHVLLHG